MRGWLMCRYSARSFTLTSPILARRSRMRRRVGLAKARKWSGSSFRGFWRNIKVALYTSLRIKGGLCMRRPRRASVGTVDQVQELGASPGIAAKSAQHAGGDHSAAGGLHATHLHAKVASLGHHADATRFQRGVERLCHLPGQLLLDLQAAREDLDQARDLAQAHDLPFGQIAHVDLAEEGQHVV